MTKCTIYTICTICTIKTSTLKCTFILEAKRKISFFNSMELFYTFCLITPHPPNKVLHQIDTMNNIPSHYFFLMTWETKFDTSLRITYVLKLREDVQTSQIWVVNITGDENTVLQREGNSILFSFWAIGGRNSKIFYTLT